MSGNVSAHRAWQLRTMLAAAREECDRLAPAALVADKATLGYCNGSHRFARSADFAALQAFAKAALRVALLEGCLDELQQAPNSHQPAIVTERRRDAQL